MVPKSKPAVSVLQEMMIKCNQTPEFTYLGQSGPTHCPRFSYRCRALGIVGDGAGRSKREAKHDAAHRVLVALAEDGADVPAAYRIPPATAPDAADEVSHVALLRELCAQYRLPAPAWRLVADTGPAHQRHFEVEFRVGLHARLAAAPSKKAARQAAAADLYQYLRKHLARVTPDFREEAALARVIERATKRAREAIEAEETPWRPDLALRVADYPTALAEALGPERLEAVRAALAGGGLRSVLEALDLPIRRDTLDATPRKYLEDGGT